MRRTIQDNAVSLSDDSHRNEKIINQGVGRKWLKQPFSDCADCSSQDGGVDDRLPRSDQLLVLPVEACCAADEHLLVTDQDQFAAHSAHTRIGEWLHQHGERVRVELLTNVGKNHDLTASIRHQCIENRRLAPSYIKPEDVHSAVRNASKLC